MPQITPSYTNRDFDGMVQEITSVVQKTRPDLISDFSDASVGALLRDLLAYTADNINYAIDSASLESFLSTCRRMESARRHAASVGYVPRPASAASVVVSPDSLPAAITQYGGTIKAGSSIKVSREVRFEVTEDVLIPVDATTIKVTMHEGTTYDEVLPFVVGSNPVYSVSNANVAADSWKVFVGTVLWSEVEDVDSETTASTTYSTDFDASGRLLVRFGNGVSGQVPTAPVRVVYRTCAGSLGNIPAKGIRGTLPISYTPPASSPVVVQVPFENYFVSQSEIGDVAQRLNEVIGYQPGIATAQLAVPRFPLQQGTLQITVETGNASVFVLKDSGNGTLSVAANTTSFVFVSGYVIPSTGAVEIVWGSPRPANGASYTANYYYFPPASARTVETLGAATGGADRESLAELKRNIISYLRSGSRMVAYKDYRSGLLRVPGVVLAYTSRFRNAYSGNVASVFTWGLEQATVTSRGTDTSGTSTAIATSTVPYSRYAKINADLSARVQRFLRERALLTVHHVIQQPGMLWADLHLGTVSYDSAYPAKVVRENITRAAVRYFQTAGGFEIRLSNLSAALLGATGVRSLSLRRIALGYGSSDAVAESVGVTGNNGAASATITGSLSRTDTPDETYIVCPGTVTIEVKQDTASTILIDDGQGNLIRSRGNLNVTSGTIDYRTRIYNVTFTTTLLPGNEITAQFDDVAEDLRLTQVVTVDDPDNGDAWPPPPTITSNPVVSPPYLDGYPLLRNGATLSGVAVAGDVLTYAPLRDVLLEPIFNDAAYYDDTYYYNDGILYNSTGTSTDIVKAVNLRKLFFNLEPLA